MEKHLKSIPKYNLLILRLWLVAQRLSPTILHHPIRCIVPDTKNVIIINMILPADIVIEKHKLTFGNIQIRSWINTMNGYANVIQIALFLQRVVVLVRIGGREGIV